MTAPPETFDHYRDKLRAPAIKELAGFATMTGKRYVVELAPGLFIKSDFGDPTVSSANDSPREFSSIASATYALSMARFYRDFEDAKIRRVD